MSVQAIKEAKREKTGPPVPDTFGLVEQSNMISMGWLTTENVLLIKLFTEDLMFNKTSKFPIFINLRTIRVETGSEGVEDFCEDPYDGWPVVEMSALNEEYRIFRRQDKFGFRWCDENLFYLVFHDDLKTTGILVDFYSYVKGRMHVSNDFSIPNHAGTACLHPCTFSNPEGIAKTDVFDIKGKTIGKIKLRYVYIRSLKQMKNILNHSLASLWKHMWSPNSPDLSNVVKTCSETRDNTVASVEATAARGFNYVEISIQYTRDNLPIFCHSPYIVVAIKSPTDIHPFEQYQVPVKKFTLSQLHGLTILPVDQCDHILKLKRKSYQKDEKNRPFPSLMQLLNSIDKEVGFVIEVSTMLPREDGHYDEYHQYDVNDNLERLLKALQQSAGRRDIILTSFHPDVCAMMRLKQNTYPVIFLLDGMPDKYPRYDLDVRCRDLDSALHFAVSMELHGVGLNDETILRPENAKKIVKDDKVVYCLDLDSTREQETKEYMAEHKLNGILCKRYDEYGRFRRSLSYLTTVKGNERKQIIAWSEESEKDGYMKPTIYPLEQSNTIISDLENMITQTPNHIAAAMSRYEATPILMMDEDERDDLNKTLN